MPETIRTILQELYTLEPELKGREAELAPLILQLVELKPEIKPTAAFAAELKSRLKTRQQELMSTSSTPSQKSLLMTIASFIRTPYLVTGAALVAIALILVSSLPGALRRTAPSYPFAASVERLPGRAFGSLLATKASTAPTAPGAGAAKLAVPEASGYASDLSFSESADSSVATTVPAGLGGGGVSASRPLIYPYPAYTYTGEPVTQLASQVDVLKRLKNFGLPLPSSFLRSFDLGNLKLDSFAEAQISQLALTEDKDFGYVINIDFLEGTVNVFENWRRWPQPGSDCQDEDCYQRWQLKPEQVPDDASLIALANVWLSEHGINTANFGAPYVQNEWRLYYAQAEDRAQAYLPDVVTVIYPWQFNGQSVYEYGGNQAGVGVNINVRYQRVASVWNLMSQQYQASAYEAETDFDVILKMATAGYQGYPMPLMEMMPVPDNYPRPMVLELGTPERGYLRYWHYDNNASQELYLPALIFPIKNLPTDSYYYAPKQVVVPLVKEFLNATNPIMDGGPVKIMPAVPPSVGAGSSSSGSAGTTIVEPEPALPPQY